MQKPRIIVTGKNGQLARELQDISFLHPHVDFLFFSKEELNIANAEQLAGIFAEYHPAFFVNCAAYTAVDKAETEQEAAYTINAKAVGSMAGFCKQYNTQLIHISTDYVFDGKATRPYKEEDAANPVNHYGYTKWLGEKLALENNEQSIIIRTSWVYSSYGNNFVKTMLRLMKERSDINVVNDQFGSPTYAADLAEAIMQIVNRQSSIVNGEQMSNIKPVTGNGIYHFSNTGIISWYEFASAIRDIKNLNCKVHPIPASSYPTPAKRPAWSVFDKEKIKNFFNMQLKDWKESLQTCLDKL